MKQMMPKSPKDAQKDRGETKQAPADPNSQKLILGAMTVMYNDKTFQKIMTLLKTGNPGNALIGTTLIILRELAKKAQGQIPPNAMIEASKAIVLLLAELSAAANIQITADDLKRAQADVAQLVERGLAGQKQPQTQAQPQPQQRPPMPQRPQGIIGRAMQPQQMGA